MTSQIQSEIKAGGEPLAEFEVSPWEAYWLKSLGQHSSGARSLGSFPSLRYGQADSQNKIKSKVNPAVAHVP